MRVKAHAGELRRILEAHDVSERQLAAWAQAKFANASFKAGLAISASVAALMGYLSYREYLADPARGAVGLAIGGVVTAIFVAAAFRMKGGGPRYASGDSQTEGFEMLYVLGRFRAEQLERLKPSDWEAIRLVDVAAWEARKHRDGSGARRGTSKERLAYLLDLKRRMKLAGLLGLIPLVILVISVPRFLAPLIAAQWWRLLLMGAVVAAVLVPVVGLHGWLFLYGYLGFLRREIVVHGEFTWDDTVHHGRWATLLGVTAMAVSILSLALLVFLAVLAALSRA